MKITLIIVLILLTVFSFYEHYSRKNHNYEKLAILDAESSKPDIHFSYIQCYPLDGNDKLKCLSKLIDTYIQPEFRNNSSYTDAFQYEAEKLGFLRFVKNYNVPCDVMENAPRFIKEVDSYLARCNDGNFYFLRFDYDHNEWHMLKR